MPIRLLIIDDEPDIRTYLMAALADSGYTTFELTEEDSITDAAIALNPNLILLDIMMPLRSGLSIYAELRQNPATRTIPVVLMTGMTWETELSNEALTERLSDQQVPMPDGLIEKPIDMEKLKTLINKLSR
ncbi:MAG: response regulator [Deltaproteobacteria bacterium]|nr:response regulator [Deltaproteobacteria bacterium]